MLRGLTPLFSLRLAAATTARAATASTSAGRGENVKVFEVYRYDSEQPEPHLQMLYGLYPPLTSSLRAATSAAVSDRDEMRLAEIRRYERYILPSVLPVNEPKMAPSLTRSMAVEAPPHRVFEKLDPIGHVVPVSEPSSSSTAKVPINAASAGRRLLIIRRKKMNKFKYKKRLKRDHFLLQKRHMKRKLKAEALFRSRMKVLRDDLAAFDPMDYVKTTIASAEREWERNLAPTGRKKYGHWSEVISLEELYGVPQSEYIDKRAGLITSPEEKAKFESKRAEYFHKYMRKRPSKSSKDGEDDDNSNNKSN